MDDATLASPLLLQAQSIWMAGVTAVRGDRAVCNALHWDGRWLSIEEETWDLSDIDRLIVVGGGKATAAMADGLLETFGRYPELSPPISGWINVPEGTFDRSCARDIHYHAARPAGLNEPTEEARFGAEKIMEWVSSAKKNDLVVCLLSGGGSALLPLPLHGISLEEKLALTRGLSRNGANIEQLNTVRKAISRIKAGGLARACQAETLMSLILSDVLGDPLSLIASGPTWTEESGNPQEAIDLLRRFDPDGSWTPPTVLRVLSQRVLEDHETSSKREEIHGHRSYHVIGNLSKAIDAAAEAAFRLGYQVIRRTAQKSEGDVSEVASTWSRELASLLERKNPICLITGGEPTVRLPLTGSGRGGRNQQLILQMAMQLEEQQILGSHRKWLILSAGTDGEDGPTDAAGAWWSDEVAQKQRNASFNLRQHLEECNAYPLHDQLKTLWKTGPTQTNVCDLRISLILPQEARDS